MKLSVLILFLFSFPAWAQGTFHLFKKGIIRPSSSFARDVYIYLPAGYEKNNLRYPVLYMQDGQNLFDPSRAFLGQTWKALATLNHLIEKKLIAPIIVVAIDNTPERSDEYIPENQADEYLQFLVNTIKPQVDQTFRTKKSSEFTGIMGSSLGGLVSLYAGLRYTETFSLIGALSPSIWWNERSILNAYEQNSHLPRKVYLDSGTTGGEKPQDVLDLGQILLNRDFRHAENLCIYIQDNADHQEKYWAMRFPVALKFLFPYRP
jgi:predicted alpha/beta superfamily hydrolase